MAKKKKKLTYGRKWKANKEGLFHERLSYWVIKKGMKLKAISDATGISNGSLSFWCNGVYEPKRKKLKILCDYLGIEVGLLDEQILTENENENIFSKKK